MTAGAHHVEAHILEQPGLCRLESHIGKGVAAGTGAMKLSFAVGIGWTQRNGAERVLQVSCRRGASRHEVASPAQWRVRSHAALGDRWRAAAVPLRLSQRSSLEAPLKVPLLEHPLEAWAGRIHLLHGRRPGRWLVSGNIMPACGS